MKLLKMFIFHAIILELYPLYSVCLNLNHQKKQNSNQNGKVEKMVVLVKTFDHYHHQFQLFELSCKIVKGFETES